MHYVHQGTFAMKMNRKVKIRYIHVTGTLGPWGIIAHAAKTVTSYNTPVTITAIRNTYVTHNPHVIDIQ